MNVCLLANNYRTLLFEKIARGLEKNGIRVFWIASSRRWADTLIGIGTPADRILCLADFRDEWKQGRASDPADPSLRLLEAGGVGANEVIMMDRELRYQPYAKAYLAVIAREISRFLEAHDIRAAFGEQTWAFEVATALLCKALGRLYLAPFTVRVPADRFGFFIGHNNVDLFEFRKPDRADREAAEGILEQLKGRSYRPYYFHINNKIQFFRRHWLGEIALQLSSKVSAGDETLPPFTRRAKWRLKRIVNTYRTRWQKPFERNLVVGERPFVLVTLHMQPESSIDVMAPRKADQLDNIRALSRVIPHGWEIYAKEHSNAIGFRPPQFYDELRQIPAVRLIDPYADTFQLMEASQLVLSPSGTVCFEAGLLGRKSATFAPMFFDPVMTPGTIDLPSLSRADFDRLMERNDNKGRIDPVSFLAWVQAQSFPGRAGDLRSDPATMAEGNIAALTDGFMTLLHALDAREQPNASVA
jgi:hypothetical protein